MDVLPPWVGADALQHRPPVLEGMGAQQLRFTSWLLTLTEVSNRSPWQWAQHRPAAPLPTGALPAAVLPSCFGEELHDVALDEPLTCPVGSQQASSCVQKVKRQQSRSWEPWQHPRPTWHLRRMSSEWKVRKLQQCWGEGKLRPPLQPHQRSVEKLTPLRDGVCLPSQGSVGKALCCCCCCCWGRGQCQHCQGCAGPRKSLRAGGERGKPLGCALRIAVLGGPLCPRADNQHLAAPGPSVGTVSPCPSHFMLNPVFCPLS